MVLVTAPRQSCMISTRDYPHLILARASLDLLSTMIMLLRWHIVVSVVLLDIRVATVRQLGSVAELNIIRFAPGKNAHVL